MEKINNALYLANSNRYILVSGDLEDTPKCPFGNNYKWIGFDLEEKKYIRFTKSVFKKLVQETEDK
ncbi:hypothetical protein [Flavobacterium sp. I3-2]|uniref:hypothetical protein n=1 Tax=Flavobacterium sp. I3-2 TaxID=2748319 RepID=UPI0015ADB05D|nr:hypothetical protein [Flavobacterium sp. I3-2]